MKKIFFFLSSLLLLVAITSNLNAQNIDNPFFKEWETPFQTPPFNEIKLEHYLPAFEEGIKQQNSEIAVVINNQEKPTFENTIEALEKSGELLTTVNRVFSSLNNTDTDDEMQVIAEKTASMLSKHGDDIYLNEKLFERIKILYDKKENS